MAVFAFFNCIIFVLFVTLQTWAQNLSYQSEDVLAAVQVLLTQPQIRADLEELLQETLPPEVEIDTTTTSPSPSPFPTSTPMPKKSMDDKFKGIRIGIFLTALETAKMSDTLKSRRLTVFAPTDAAFEAALKSLDLTAEELLQNVDLLNQILKNHVVAKTITDFDDGDSYVSEAGEALTISQSDEDDQTVVRTENFDAQIVAFEIQEKRAVIHAIDNVLLPGEKSSNQKPKNSTSSSLLSAIQNSERLTTLAKIMEAADLIEVLNDKTLEYTIFAPNNFAFLQIFGEELGVEVFSSIRQEILLDMLYYHIVPTGKFDKNMLKDGEEFLTLIEGENLTVATNKNSKVIKGTQNQGNIVEFDLFGGRGVIHIVDRVLDYVPSAPPNEQSQNATKHDGNLNNVIDEENSASLADAPIFEMRETPVGEVEFEFSSTKKEKRLAPASVEFSSPEIESVQDDGLSVTFNVSFPASEEVKLLDASKKVQIFPPNVEQVKEDQEEEEDVSNTTLGRNLSAPALSPIPLDQMQAVVESSVDTFITAVDIGSIEIELNGQQGYTIFAPTASAFTKLLESYNVPDIESLDQQILRQILLQHILVDRFIQSELEPNLDFIAIESPFLRILDENNSTVIASIGSRANIVIPNLAVESSIVHIVDNVLLPFAPMEKISNRTCTDISPDVRFDCSEQKQFGKCEESWMVEGNFCLDSCGRCGILSGEKIGVCDLGLVEKLKGVVKEALEEDGTSGCRGSELEEILLQMIEKVIVES